MRRRRAQILAGLKGAGIRLDAVANASGDTGERRISAPDSRVDTWIVPVDEAMILAEAAMNMLVNCGPAPQATRRTT